MTNDHFPFFIKVGKNRKEFYNQEVKKEEYVIYE